MKTIGLIGGMSWESTKPYYEGLNHGIKDALGGLHSAKVLMYSFDFDEIVSLQRQGRWDECARQLSDVARRLYDAGAEALLICTNTMHKVFDEVQAAVPVPVLHIADALGEAVTARGDSRIALLGTRFVMEQPFYMERLKTRYGIECVVPESEADRQCIHDVIFNELCQGQLLPASRARYLDIIDSLTARGATAVTLACTEIGLLIRPQDTAVPLFDTTEQHINAAVKVALSR